MLFSTKETLYAMTENLTVYAIWEINFYTITFDPNEGILEDNEKYLAYDSELGELPTPERTGYTFNNWWTSAEGGTQISSATRVADSNATYYAHWTINPYTVTCEDWFVGGSNNLITKLGEYSKESNYGVTVYGSEWGDDSSISAYHQYYKYVSCTSATVTTSGATVYRYFYGYNIIKVLDPDGNDSLDGSVAKFSISYNGGEYLTNQMYGAPAYAVLPYGAEVKIKDIDMQEDYYLLDNVTWSGDELTPDDRVYTATYNTVGKALYINTKYKEYEITYDYNINRIRPITDKIVCSGFNGSADHCFKLGYFNTDDLASNDNIKLSFDVEYSGLTVNTAQNYSFWPEGEGNITRWSLGIGGYDTFKMQGSGTYHYESEMVMNESRVQNNDYYQMWLRTDYITGGIVTISNIKMSKGEKDTITKTFGTPLNTLPEITSTGHTFDGWWTLPIGGTQINSSTPVPAANTTYYAHWTVNKYYLDLNGFLDNNIAWNISDYGTADIYINGQLVANDYTDYCDLCDYGSVYEIKDIKATAGHTYNGVYSGSISGIIGDDNIYVHLDFTSNEYTITFDSNVNNFLPDSDTITCTGFSGRTNHCFSLGSFSTDGFEVGDKIKISFDIAYSNITANNSQDIWVDPQCWGDVNGWSYGIRWENIKINGSGSYHFEADNQGMSSDRLKNNYFGMHLRTDYITSGTITITNIKILQEKVITKTYKTSLGTLPTLARIGYTFNGWWTAPTGGTQISSSTLVPAADTTYYAHWTGNEYTITYDSNINNFTPNSSTITCTGFSGRTNHCFGLGSFSTNGFEIGDKIKISMNINYSNLTNNNQSYNFDPQCWGDVNGWDAGIRWENIKLVGSGSYHFEADNQGMTSGRLTNNYYNMHIRSDYITGGTITITDIKIIQEKIETKTCGNNLGTLPTLTRSGKTFKGWWTAPSGGTQITSSTKVPPADTTYYAHWQ